MKVIKMTSVYKAMKVLNAWSEQFETYPKKIGRLTALQKKALALDEAKKKYYKLVREYLQLRMAKAKRDELRSANRPRIAAK
jgi:hypothetical protein